MTDDLCFVLGLVWTAVASLVARNASGGCPALSVMDSYVWGKILQSHGNAWFPVLVIGFETFLSMENPRDTSQAAQLPHLSMIV